MLRHGVIAESITNFVFKSESFILCVVNYCTDFNLFQSALNVSKHCLVFFLSILHFSILVLCCILNTDFSLSYRNFCSAAAFHRTSWVSAAGLPDVGLGDPNSQGCMGMKEKEILYC